MSSGVKVTVGVGSMHEVDGPLYITAVASFFLSVDGGTSKRATGARGIEIEPGPRHSPPDPRWHSMRIGSPSA